MLPKDAVMINPTFRDRGALTNPGNLATDLLNIANIRFGAARQITVKMYDLEEAKPRYPKATKVANTSLAAEGSVMREVALCLSYYSGQNVKRKRGRLYLPLCCYAAPGSIGLRPTAQQIADTAAWASDLKALGGVDVDWGVYSAAAHAFYGVTNWWVDDEWDIQRRRGMRSITRTTGTTSENP